jgi:GNAT superfamily N-acetyltransferase
MATRGTLSGLEYDPRQITDIYSDDSPNNPRADGGFLVIEVQENLPDFNTNKGEGWITLWHKKTVKPHVVRNDPDPPLPESPTTPIFVAELKLLIDNEAFTVEDRPKPSLGKDRSEPVHIDPPFSKICVPYIMIQPAYQGRRLAPALWYAVADIAQKNGQIQINLWERAKKSHQKITLEPPLDTIAVLLPDPTLRQFWDKTGFNFLAAQHQNAWDFDNDTKVEILQVFNNQASEEVQTRISKYFTIATGELRGRTDYIQEIAVDGLDRGNWTRVNGH